MASSNSRQPYSATAAAYWGVIVIHYDDLGRAVIEHDDGLSKIHSKLGRTVAGSASALVILLPNCLRAKRR
jgi:hypothetical protein